MTTDTGRVGEPGAGIGASPLMVPLRGMFRGKSGPVATLLIALIVFWYIAAVFLNAPFQRETMERSGEAYSFGEMVKGTLSQKRPLLPAPHQVAAEIWSTTAGQAITSKRSLIYHGWVTLSSTLVGFFMGTAIGIALAIAIVHSRTLDRSLMPWIIASQTIPILALAPMIIVVLAAIGLTGLIPKAVISTYLSFFPVVVGMVKGLRSPETMQLDLLRTYHASPVQTLLTLRLPASMPFLFASMKIGVAASLLGAIVGELPTGAVAGLGARLLAGSYYGQTVQIWSALIAASLLAAILVTLVGWAENMALARMGARK